MRTILLPQHLDDLRKSGLSDEQIAACGFRSAQKDESIQKKLRWDNYDGQLGPCLAIPFRDVDGEPTEYWRLKPDRPRKDKDDGKAIKYESPKGLANRAFFPPGTLAALKDPSKPLIITEGEKKAAKADQEGFPCIGLVGVYGWTTKRPHDDNGKATGERELIEDLEIPWQGRVVYICFDSDAVDNPNVCWAEWHLAEALRKRGAVVRVVRLPGGNANGQ